MPWVWIAVVASLIVLTGLRWRPGRRCRHRFGLPLHNAVRCMRCTRKFSIQADDQGGWKIAPRPLEETE